MTNAINGQPPGNGAREEIELLLPWYLNGTLAASDVAKVETYLDSHPDMATQLATLREDMDESIYANEAITGPSGAALDRLMADIEQETPMRHRVAQVKRGFLTSIDEFLRSLSPGRLGFAAMAAAAVIMLQAGFVGTMMLSPPSGGSTYETASGDPALTGTFVLIQFKPGASFNQVSTLLSEQGAEIVAGPKPGGLFRVRVSTKKLDDAQRLALIDNLRSNDTLINMVLPSQ